MYLHSIVGVATVLTVYGIETIVSKVFNMHRRVATVLTVYGIETGLLMNAVSTNTAGLQQYLPFTVLKLYRI